jgi:hypothetical protein
MTAPAVMHVPVSVEHFGTNEDGFETVDSKALKFGHDGRALSLLVEPASQGRTLRSEDR